MKVVLLALLGVAFMGCTVGTGSVVPDEPLANVVITVALPIAGSQVGALSVLEMEEMHIKVTSASAPQTALLAEESIQGRDTVSAAFRLDANTSWYLEVAVFDGDGAVVARDAMSLQYWQEYREQLQWDRAQDDFDKLQFPLFLADVSPTYDQANDNLYTVALEQGRVNTVSVSMGYEYGQVLVQLNDNMEVEEQIQFANQAIRLRAPGSNITEEYLGQDWALFYNVPVGGWLLEVETTIAGMEGQFAAVQPVNVRSGRTLVVNFDAEDINLVIEN